MDIIIMHQTVTNHDAIGNDIEEMYHLLSKRYNCYVYAINQFNDKVEYITKNDMMQKIAVTECVIIYHHSVFWQEGYDILNLCKGRIIFRYHNITPPEFFEEYNDFHYSQCYKGRMQTVELMRNFKDAFWISDSKFNAEDLTEVDSDHILICPPFNKIEDWAKKSSDDNILKSLIESEEINLLFVGRVVPNKGHMTLLDILRVFVINYKKKIKLRIIGKFDDSLELYNQLINTTIKNYGIAGCIEFVGEINDSTLMSYYLGSDIMICTSEHEGFCVPVIEAQYFGLPVLALNACAVPETIGQNQLLFDKNSALFAAAIMKVFENDTYYEYLRKEGIDNYNKRFSKRIISETFMSCFEKGLGI